MQMEILHGDILAKTCDLLVVNFFQGTKKLSGATASVDKALDGQLGALLESSSFEGKMGERLVLPTFGKLKARRIAVIGLGRKEAFSADSLRQIGGHIVRLAKAEKASTVVTVCHGVTAGKLSARETAQALVEGTMLGAYEFKLYHGTQAKKNGDSRKLSRITIMESDARTFKQAQEGFETGRVLSDATILARDLVNTPSSDMTPLRMAEEAKKLATRGSGTTCKILDQKTMERMGMHATLAVARGSMHPPVGVHLTYRPAKSKKTVALIGKAVTFDSGGLSIKPADGMMTMKIDMAGAAAVIGTFKALAALKPNVTVHGIFLAVENMPSGSAYRPGDVVEAMDGTTIEVLNTDAEGRLTLADALCYAKKLEPDMMIDLATLTGACIVALGDDVAGLMSTNDALSEKLLTASKETGEPLWRLPLYEPYAQLIKSKIADIKNIGGGRIAGTITAAFFLKTFVDDIPWAHMDVAGPTYVERETRPDQPYGASGYGVRLLTKFLQGIGR